MKVNSPEFVISQTATITDLSLQAMEEEQTDRSNVTCLGTGYKISCTKRLSMLYSSAVQVSIHWRRSHLGQFPSLHADERPECGICRLYCADPRPRGLERTPDPRGPQRTPEYPESTPMASTAGRCLIPLSPKWTFGCRRTELRQMFLGAIESAEISSAIRENSQHA